MFDFNENLCNVLFFFFFDLGGRVLTSDVRSGLKKFGESREERRESYEESSRERKGETAGVDGITVSGRVRSLL